MIEIGQHVRVMCGGQHGLVGHVFNIDSGQVVVILQDDNDPPPVNVPLCSLVPEYQVGDSVEARWHALSGLLVLINESTNSLMYAESQHVIVSFSFIRLLYLLIP